MRSILLFLTLLWGYHILFWHELMGLNLFVFGLAVIAIGFFKNRPFKLLPVHWFLLVLSLANGVAVLWVNTSFSMVLFVLLSITTYGSFQLSTNAALEAFANSLFNIFNPRQGLIPGLAGSIATPKIKGVLYLRLSIIPLLIFFIYILLFSAGNSIFHSWSGRFMERFMGFFEGLSLEYFFFILLGIIIVRWVMRTGWAKFISLVPNNNLQRKVRVRYFKNMALKHEYLSAFILLVLLNLLFLAVNVIDIRWVWFQFYVPADFSLKEFVHDGVFWLICTLLISMGLILHYFRGNLNFYKDNNRLKTLAYFWIFQNAILTFSVVLRTLYYVDFHGLASGRIGLLLFLGMVLFGLFTLAWKIKRRYNTSFVLRVNTLFVIGLLGISALFPWNHIMVRYNLSHGNVNEIDVDYYLQLDPQVFPVVYENLDLIGNQIEGHQKNEVTWISYASIEAFEKQLELKSRDYLHHRSEKGWASWSRADQKAVTALEDLID